MTTALAIFGLTLALLAVILTVAMFATKQMMLGFPSGIFWAVTGGYAYELSVAAWDAFYLLFFACMGMTIFSIYAAFAVRRADLESSEFESEPKLDLDEEKEFDDGFEEKPRTSKRTEEIRSRAFKRRTPWEVAD